LLEGKIGNLKVMEKEDLPFFAEWYNNPEFFGEFVWLPQQSKMDREKWYENLPADAKFFFILKKDDTRIGTITHFPVGNVMEIGYLLVQNERGKGYCSEAVMIMVDYLFLSRDIVRIQAHTDLRNVASQRVLEKVGFKKEGIIRKNDFARGEWRDNYLYSILREEWKEPRILTINEKKNRN
jgi:RimJ/RimL family protein N-acetyltransferase